MGRLNSIALAAVLILADSVGADEVDESPTDQMQLIMVAIDRVDSLVPAMSGEAIQLAKQRVLAIEAQARARQESLHDERWNKEKDLEIEWRSRWSLPVHDTERREPFEPIPDSDRASFENTDGFPGLIVRPPELGLEESSTEGAMSAHAPIAAVAAEPQFLSEERDLLIADGIASFGRALQEASRAYNLRPGFLLCVMQVESGFNPTAISHAGAIGLMQLMPTTAEELGANPYDLTENITGGARLISSHLDHYSGDVALAMAAYNAGPGAVERYRGVPPYPETQSYVVRILQNCGDPRP